MGWIYKPHQENSFRISRSKIDLFLECPKCLYLDLIFGVKRPSLPGFSLNSAVDILLKKEFDLLRNKNQQHEIMKRYRIDAVCFNHPDLENWRNNFKGKEYHHKEANLIIFGAVDDIWINPNKELIIVDYKSTSTESEISLDDYWKKGYKKQLEIYSYIFERSGFSMADTAYIVYANAIKSRNTFDSKLEFELTLHAHKTDCSWIDKTILDIKRCLDGGIIPEAGEGCEYCNFRKNASRFDKKIT